MDRAQPNLSPVDCQGFKPNGTRIAIMKEYFELDGWKAADDIDGTIGSWVNKSKYIIRVHWDGDKLSQASD